MAGFEIIFLKEIVDDSGFQISGFTNGVYLCKRKRMERTGLRLCFAHIKFEMSEDVHRMRSIITHGMAKALGDPIPISELVDTHPNLYTDSSLSSSVECDRSSHLETHWMLRHYIKCHIRSAKMNSTAALEIYPEECEGFCLSFGYYYVFCNVMLS